MDLVEKFNHTLDTESAKIRLWEQRYAGDSPLTFLTPEAVKALGGRLKALNVNYCRLSVDALVERIRVDGFLIDGQHDESLWQLWRDSGMQDGSQQAFLDALATGRGFISVWADDDGTPTVTPESPSQCTVKRDPVSHKVTAGFKRWVEDETGFGVLYTPEKITVLRSKAYVSGGVIPPSGWDTIESRPNPLGVVPLVPLVNRGRTTDVHGVSEQALISDLNDAIVKLMVDSLVTSESYARPRRWATGIEIREDENGNPIDPFAGADRLMQSEKEDSKFGQFDAADMSSYSVMISSMVEQISALSGLPSHYLTFQQPGTGEETRAREVSLVARAQRKLTGFGQDVGQVARLMIAVRDNRPLKSIRAEVVWADPATRTLAQESDAVVKLASGDRPILPISEAQSKLGYSPERIAQIQGELARESAQRLALTALGEAGTL